jgi:hypothetical protein
MPVSLRKILFGVFLMVALSGCGIQFEESPESWGSTSGTDGAKLWIEKEGSSVYPSSDGVAAFCVSMSEEGQKKFNWTVEEIYASTDACAKAFVDGLQ